MSESGTETDRLDQAHQNGQPGNPLIRLIADLMSNKHRGYAGLRAGGGPHPVPSVGVETGGKNAEFADIYTEADVIAFLRDGILGNNDHILKVQAAGPFSGYSLPGREFTPGQHAFPAFVAGTTPQPFRVVNANAARLDVLVKAHILNDGLIYIGNTENSASPSSGYPLTQGEVVTIPARAEIWACSTSTTQATLALLTTLRDG